MFGSVGEKDVGSQIAIVLLGFIRLTLLILCLCLGLRLTHGTPVNDTDTIAVNEYSRKFTVLGEGHYYGQLLRSILTKPSVNYDFEEKCPNHVNFTCLNACLI